jgi:hypothetical protein
MSAGNKSGGKMMTIKNVEHTDGTVIARQSNYAAFSLYRYATIYTQYHSVITFVTQ